VVSYSQTVPYCGLPDVKAKALFSQQTSKN